MRKRYGKKFPYKCCHSTGVLHAFATELSRHTYKKELFRNQHLFRSLAVLVYDHKFRMKVTRSVLNSYKRLIEFRSGLARNCCTHSGRLREWRKRGEEDRIEEGLEWRVRHGDFRFSNYRVKMHLVFGHLSFKRNTTHKRILRQFYWCYSQAGSVLGLQNKCMNLLAEFFNCL